MNELVDSVDYHFAREVRFDQLPEDTKDDRCIDVDIEVGRFH